MGSFHRFIYEYEKRSESGSDSAKAKQSFLALSISPGCVKQEQNLVKAEPALKKE